MKFGRRRPTVETLFHIDWDWFERSNLDAERVVRRQLCDACQGQLVGQPVAEVDFIDTATGEVFRVDTLREAILAHCQWQREFLSEELPLSQALLRALLAANNRPTSASDLAVRTRRDPEMVLRVLTASGVQNGIVPLHG